MGTATNPRGTSNSNRRGSSYARRRRKEWLLETYPADVAEVQVWWYRGEVVAVTPVDPQTKRTTEPEFIEWGRIDPGFDALSRGPACRCYRCGKLLSMETVTVDRIVPECKGGTYRRTNIRPACLKCNSETGGALAKGKEHQKAKKAARARSSRTPAIIETVRVVE